MPRPQKPPADLIVAEAITKWMAGEDLTPSEQSIVESALIVNAADQFIRCSEVYSDA